jgi:stearoyl-CoA desaturase (delta-9 desaturase)
MNALLAVAVGLLVTQLATLATTVYLHRTLAHRAITMQPWLAFVFRVITWITTGLKPREWPAVHRKHHAFTDTEGDPHSPILLGWGRVQLTNAPLYRRVARDPETLRRYARDLPADQWDRVLFDRSWLGLAIGITILILALGPVWGLVAALVHVVAYLNLNAAINALGHTFGRQPYPNSATNLQWLAFLTAGEGLHNNHHAAPTSARFALARGEIDLGWWVIRVFRKLGWVTVRHEKPVIRTADPVSSRR